MNSKHNIQISILLFLLLMIGVGESMAGVAYNQIKDGGVYTISCYFSTNGAKKFVSYDGTMVSYGNAPAVASNSYWIAHRNTNGTFSFESFGSLGNYLNGNSGIAGTSDAPGSDFTLYSGFNDNTDYVSLQTSLSQGTRYMGGWRDEAGFGNYIKYGCVGQSKNQSTWSTDWEFVDVSQFESAFSSAPQNGEWADGTRWYHIIMPMTNGYLSQGDGYVDGDGYMLSDNTTKPTDDMGLWCFVKHSNGRFYMYNKGTGTTKVLSIARANDSDNNEKLQMINLGDQSATNYNSEQAWQYCATGRTVNGNNDDGYFFYRHNQGYLHRVFNIEYQGNKIVTTYRDGTNNVTSSTAWDEKFVLVPSSVSADSWTVSITENGSASSYKVVYDNHEYSDGETISAGSITPQSVSTTCNDKFVWGPIIDVENHTVAFEVRSTQEGSITAGRFYQLQMFNKEGQWFDSSVKSGNMVDGVNSCTSPSIRYKGSQIYLMNARAAGYPLEFTGVVPESEIYYSYVYVPTVIDNNVHIESQNGSYVHNNGSASNSPVNISFAYDSTNKTFKWPGKVGPWSWTSTANWITVGMTGNFSQANYNIELFFHPVTTGEDYDIYKVMNNDAAVVCNSSSLVTTITNAGGTFFFVQKNAVLSASDFTINGEEPQSISSTVNGGFIELTLTERAHEVHEITTLADITDMYGYYKLTADVNAPAQITEFHGHLDGNYHKITGLTHAIFNTVIGAKISNLILEDVTISGGDIVGAIANTATGNSRVYNCGVLSGSVNGSTEAGSIVGRIEGNARVVNCYSYANVSGGSVAGIVGNNAGTSAVKETVFNGTGTLVMNCAHFGRLSGSSVYPVFGGNDINNVSGVNTYNYYIYDASVSYASPNSAQGTEETAYFNRFDFYRGILNSHRELAAMYIHGTQNVSQEQIENIAHWKYDSNVAEYLSQEPWPKNTTSTLSREIPSTDEAYKGKQVGTVSATFIINGYSETVTLPLTDMNTDRWDYTYGKVVLPFANEFSGWTMPASGNTAYDNIITGWEVTNITGGTAGTYSNYNLCDPDCTAKDLYENNNYVWAQGGNFVVPKDVTAITFTAHIVRAVYLRDTHPDIAYNENYSSRVNLGTPISGTYNGKTVYNSIADAFANLENKTNPADQAIVLVGNYHLNREFPQSTGVTPHQAKAVTIMSIDADNNQEPDYCLYQFNTQGSGRVSMPPIRFDFVVSPGFAMASYTKGGLLAGIGIIHAKGWFETTETAMLTMSEFEMRPDYYNQNSPVILNGGEFSRILMTSTNEYGIPTDKLLYTKIGGKAYVETLNLGRTSSVPANSVVSLHPLNVSGGEIVNCHLTGSIHNGITSGDVNFYCNGGYIHEFNGAYQEKLNGNMIAKMDHALIDEFYGGGADDAYGDTPQITGDINIICNNSYVKFFCGGPKFGNMASGKTVTVTATGSTFDEYYGASYGGTALTAFEKSHQGTSFSGNENITFAIPWTNYTSERLAYNSARRGIGVNFDLDFFQYAGGGQATGNQSFYVKYASLSLAKTGSVTSTMTNCTFNGHFFGGGCRGLVDGNVTSTLTDCIVNGNAYGGGYTPTATECMVYPETQPTYPVYKGLYGLFTKYVRTSEPDAYRWVQADDGHASGSVDKTNKLLYTSVDMTQMGVVTGNTTLTIKGSGSLVTGDVFGGGAESKVLGNSTVTIGEQPQP